MRAHQRHWLGHAGAGVGLADVRVRGVALVAGREAVVAAGLRAKDSLMQTAEKVQASGGDILAEAKEINEARSEELFAEEAKTVEAEVKAAEPAKAADTKKEAKGDK